MLSAYVSSFDPQRPLAGLTVGDQPRPPEQEGRATVRVTRASLNHHDLWSLRGVGLADESLPMILGCDAVGTVTSDDHPLHGRRVIIYPVISERVGAEGDETLDPRRTLLSEAWQGTLAEYVSVPSANLVPLPEGLDESAAACLPTAYLTAYRMLFTQANVGPGSAVLVQGAGGGVSLAAVQLALAAGCTVYVCGRDEGRLARVAEISVAGRQPQTFASGARLPQRVDAVIESVGEATWSHSLKALRPGGCIVVCGATSGAMPPADLQRVFFLQLRVLGSTMGTREELEGLLDFMNEHALAPVIDSELPLADAAVALARLEAGENFGKIVLTVGAAE
ncbi:zinc-binding dehydrogenase [Micrococcales bacterium 31B]|nr:zinc-binding dehydrogenase [Micrococcales bacterium 31B]